MTFNQFSQLSEPVQITIVIGIIIVALAFIYAVLYQAWKRW